MKTLKTKDELREYIKDKQDLGFTPTMGALHSGHAALFKESLSHNGSSLVSIFVNPTQFNDQSDYDTYPNTLEQDLSLCESLGVEAVFTPEKKELYSDHDTITLAEYEISRLGEGAMRPGHFSGVLQILLKLLNLIKPKAMYMGEKDYQQLLLTRLLCRQFFIDCNIVGVPTVRDESGLPYSSRNLKLSDQGLAFAKRAAETFLKTSSQKDFEESTPGLKLDYYETLNDRVIMAHRVEGIRLLDNKERS